MFPRFARLLARLAPGLVRKRVKKSRAKRRPRWRDERKGDDILYPTDKYTDHMQPRR